MLLTEILTLVQIVTAWRRRYTCKNTRQRYEMFEAFIIVISLYYNYNIAIFLDNVLCYLWMP